MFDFLAGAVAFFYKLWPSYGMAIVLFTLAIYLVLTPLTIKSTRSMIAMQRVQPELKKLQAKFKDDKETLQKEMMAFYQANNINPFSSCLPLLLQMPVFFVLFRILNGLTKKGADGTFEPGYLKHDSALYQALDKSREMVSWGIDLARSASSTLSEGGVVQALPFLLLVGLVVFTSWFQQRQIAGRNPNAAANPQQQMIGKIMPFIFAPISFGLPAGVVLYFVTSNLVRIGQQALVTKLEYGKDKLPGGDASGNGAKPKDSPPPAKPAAAAAKPPAPQNRARNKKKRR